MQSALKPLSSPRSRRPLTTSEQSRQQLQGAISLASALVRHSIDTIRDALDVLLSDTSSRDRRRQALRDLADEVGWLTADDGNPLGFRALCEALRLNAAMIREQIATELNRLPGREMVKFVDQLRGVSTKCPKKNPTRNLATNPTSRNPPGSSSPTF